MAGIVHLTLALGETSPDAVNISFRDEPFGDSATGVEEREPTAPKRGAAAAAAAAAAGASGSGAGGSGAAPATPPRQTFAPFELSEAQEAGSSNAPLLSST